jgi:hypothetical protein
MKSEGCGQMTDSKNLPYLMQLLDDDSPVVRQEVCTALLSFGTSLSEALAQMPEPPTGGQRDALETLLRDFARQEIMTLWPSWYGLEESPAKLEAALTLLTQYQNVLGPKLSTLLDGLAHAFDEAHPSADSTGTRGWGPPPLPGPRPAEDALLLAQFLFRDQGFHGADDDDDPDLDNLVQVIQSQKGNAVSLACIFILVGHRLDLRIAGCNWPGHFMAQTLIADKVILVDCVNKGRTQDEASFLKMQGPSRDAAASLLAQATSSEVTVIRLLKHILHSYEQRKLEIPESEFHLVGFLLRDLQGHNTPHPC